MAKTKPDDDLFQDSTMTFGEHLEELRGCLFRAVIGLAIGFALGLAVGRHVVQFIQAPLESALVDYYQKKAVKRITEKYGSTVSDDALHEMQNRGLIFEQVLIEPREVIGSLRQIYPRELGQAQLPDYGLGIDDVSDIHGLVRSIVAGEDAAEPSPARSLWKRLSADEQARWKTWSAADALGEEDRREVIRRLNELLEDDQLYDADNFAGVRLAPDFVAKLSTLKEATRDERRRSNWLLLSSSFAELLPPRHTLAPMLLWRTVADDTRVSVKTLSAQEAFMIWLKAALITGVVISGPWILYQLWLFVAAGLYPHERSYIYVFLPFSVLLFLSGAALAYFFVFAQVLSFLLGFNDWLGLDPDPRISEWLSFVLWMPIGFGVSFQLPLVMLFVAKLGILDSNTFLAKWRVAVLGIFIASAVITPSGDPYSMLMMAGPLTILYFGGVLLCKRVESKVRSATNSA